MGYDKEVTVRRLTKGQETPLAERVVRVVESDCKRVAKGGGCFFKGDMVLFEVSSRLLRIPLELHAPIITRGYRPDLASIPTTRATTTSGVNPNAFARSL